jgi:hypothetical protein
MISRKEDVLPDTSFNRNRKLTSLSHLAEALLRFSSKIMNQLATSEVLLSMKELQLQIATVHGITSLLQLLNDYN